MFLHRTLTWNIVQCYQYTVLAGNWHSICEDCQWTHQVNLHDFMNSNERGHRKYWHSLKKWIPFSYYLNKTCLVVVGFYYCACITIFVVSLNTGERNKYLKEVTLPFQYFWRGLSNHFQPYSRSLQFQKKGACFEDAQITWNTRTCPSRDVPKYTGTWISWLWAGANHNLPVLPQICYCVSIAGVPKILTSERAWIARTTSKFLHYSLVWVTLFHFKCHINWASLDPSVDAPQRVHGGLPLLEARWLAVSVRKLVLLQNGGDDVMAKLHGVIQGSVAPSANKHHASRWTVTLYFQTDIFGHLFY